MRIKYLLLLAALFLNALLIYAQDFEADSILYTPIPKHEEKQNVSKKILRDTGINDPFIAYFFNLQAGPLIGCNDCSSNKEVTFTSSTTHGITIGKKLRTGFGIGLDSYYDWQTLPVFGSVSWDLLGTKNTNALFVQFNYGWAKPWHTKTSNEPIYYKEVTGGRMASTQIGYRIKYHDLRISFAVGSKLQRVYSYYEYPTWLYQPDGSVIQGPPNTQSIREDMSRLMLTMTVGWK